jgi:GT2 family glycosyltransferase
MLLNNDTRPDPYCLERLVDAMRHDEHVGICASKLVYEGRTDDDFFIHDEDADLNARAQLAGWTCRFVPEAVTHHIGHATSGWLSDWHVYYRSRNLDFV